MKDHIVILILLLVTQSIWGQENISAVSIEINNLKVGLGNNGVIGNVFGNSTYSATIDSGDFLYSSGFLISGISNGKIWSSGVLSSASIDVFAPGNVNSNSSNPMFKIFELNSNEPDFSDSWIEWQQAVDQGALFYDGNNNSIYDPIDHNGNGIWDIEEDRPDLLGDYTAWCVYNDAADSAYRKFDDFVQQGIEIRQTVFATGLHNDNTLDNTFFVRYIIENTGSVAEIFDSVYFGIAADPDIGENYDNDLVGADSLNNAGYAFSQAPESPFGYNPPCLYIDQLNGPQAFIPGETFIDGNNDGYYDDKHDTPIDTAIVARGPFLGIKKIPGAKNLHLNAVVHMGRHFYISDPDNQTQLRYNLVGGVYSNGDSFTVCEWPWGNGSELDNCEEINPKFMYSGDPVTHEGWLDIAPQDTRLILSSGPFYIQIGKPVEIIVAYIVGRGTDAINSITVAREIDDYVQQIYDNNFADLPVGIKDNSDELPSDFSLSQNYPNPFNPTTTINYQIPKHKSQINSNSLNHSITQSKNNKMNVHLAVYDILGREVTVIVEELQKPGKYEVQFDAFNLPSGIYFYTLTAGNYRKTNKMTLLK